MYYFIFIIILLFRVTAANCDDIPPNAYLYLPILERVINSTWSDAPYRSSFAGQIEQETCISLKHSKCWSPFAELKTSREYGFGLGQITIVWDSSGRERFNNFINIKKIDYRLENWTWEDRYNPRYQMMALVSYDKYLYNLIKFPVYDEFEKMAFTLSAYNGGLGGVIKDRQLCEVTENCDPTKWFDNVERVSYKAKVAISEYKKSFFQINREYVDNILNHRRFKYIYFLGE